MLLSRRFCLSNDSNRIEPFNRASFHLYKSNETRIPLYFSSKKGAEVIACYGSLDVYARAENKVNLFSKHSCLQTMNIEV